MTGTNTAVRYFGVLVQCDIHAHTIRTDGLVYASAIQQRCIHCMKYRRFRIKGL
jgi:hypothetical protein